VIESDSYSNTDYISLLTFTLEQIETLEPYKYLIESRFEKWIQTQEKNWLKFTPEQFERLETIKDEIANSLTIWAEQFEYGKLAQKWWFWGAYKVFGNKLNEVVEEMNRELV